MKSWKKRNLNILTFNDECNNTDFDGSPTFEGEESLIAPSEDKRPTMDRINLNIPQAFGLAQTPQEKSLFRYHPFNPMKYEKPLSPGAEIGNYYRSPRESLAALSPRNSDAKMSRKSARGTDSTGSKKVFLRTPRTSAASAAEMDKKEKERQWQQMEKLLDRSGTSEYLE